MNPKPRRRQLHDHTNTQQQPRNRAPCRPLSPSLYVYSPVLDTQTQSRAPPAKPAIVNPNCTTYMMRECQKGTIANSAKRSSTARATCSVAWPARSRSSCSTARRSLLCAAKPSTSLESSSARSVRLLPSHDLSSIRGYLETCGAMANVREMMARLMPRMDAMISNKFIPYNNG